MVAETIGTNRPHSWICFLICLSQASPPRSSFLSNQISKADSLNKSPSQIQSFRTRFPQQHNVAEDIVAMLFRPLYHRTSLAGLALINLRRSDSNCLGLLGLFARSLNTKTYFVMLE